MTKSIRRSSYKNRKKIKKITLVDLVLISLFKMMHLYQELKDPFGLVSNYHQLIYGRSFSKEERLQYKKTINYCYKKKYFIEKNKKLIVEKRIIKKIKMKSPYLFYQKKDWDKKFRLVIFDIKESERKKRNQLRYILNQLGFVFLQKSVWISPLDQLKNLKLWLKKYGLEKEVVIIETKNIEFKNKEKIINAFFS